MNKWMKERMNEWMNEWMKGWINEWMNDIPPEFPIHVMHPYPTTPNPRV